jgi:hypothetical protein
MSEQKYSPLDYDEVYCRYIKRKGKIIYPKNGKFFHFWVKKKPDAKKTTDLPKK